MKITPRRIWWTLCGLALAGLLASAFRPQPIEIETVRCERGPLLVTVNAEGKTRLQERYVVSAPLAGRLLRVELKPGDPIEAGQTVLAALEPTDPELLDPRARAQAEARVKAARATRQRADAQLARARTNAEYARTELERGKRLHSEGMLSQQDLEHAEQAAHLAGEELRAAGFAVEIAAFELEQARAALLGGPAPGASAAATPWRFELRAPISGRVLRVLQESAAVVPAGARLLEIGDPRALEIEIEVLSSDAVKITPGARVLLEQWGGDVPLEARVRVVEPSAFTKISALGVEEQRLHVIADFTGPEEERRAVGDGFRVEARIVTSEATDVLQAPAGALFREGEDWAVFVVEGDRAVRRKIQIGRRNDKVAEVRSGLTAGETLIVYPSDRIDDGVRVRVRGG